MAYFNEKAATVTSDQTNHDNGQEFEGMRLLPSAEHDTTFIQDRLFDLPPADEPADLEAAKWREEATAWAQAFPEAYERFNQLLHKYAVVLHRPVSAKWAIGTVQIEGYCDREGNRIGFNNNCLPYLARDFADAHPGSEQFIKTRRSRADRFRGCDYV